MKKEKFVIDKLTLKPISINFYVPPVVWKGDPVGHIGEKDVFFWILEGEIILFIDSDYYILRPGQLAFLPKGKKRRYTPLSKKLSMYTMGFFAEADGVNLMEGLGLTEGNYVVNIENTEEVIKLFEKSSCVEFSENPLNNILWSANILEIIHIYADVFQTQSRYKDEKLIAVTEYMKNNLCSDVAIDELSEIACMEKSYFIRKFKKFYGVPPMVYLKNLRMQMVMEALLAEDKSTEEIAKSIGIYDISYFYRWFKKNCGLSPNEYRNILK